MAKKDIFEEERLADNFYENGEPINAEDCMKRIAQEIGGFDEPILLAFSTGKDSIDMFLRVREYFPNVVPCFRAFIPNLAFNERRIRYYEDVFKTEIQRVQSAHFYNMLRNLVFQPPWRVETIKAMDIPTLDQDDINRMLWESLGLAKKKMWCAVGVRAADSLQRRATCKSKGPIRWNQNVFWPNWDKSHEDLAVNIKAHGVKLFPEYKYWGTSFDGLRLFFMKEFRQRYPQDYERIREWFPFVELEFSRYELAKELEKLGPHGEETD
jgi:hypothetical protein